MRTIHISAVLFAFAVGAFGCASEEDDASSGSREWDVQSEKKSDDSAASPDGKTPSGTAPDSPPPRA